jgi:uncharacterized protein YjbJ (UPF0337 family)
MDKDRVEGSSKKIKGDIKEKTGELLGDEKMKSEGKGDKVAGKIQNAIGGVKDAIKKRD